MNLSDYAAHYGRARDIAPSTGLFYRYAVSTLETCIGRPVAIEECSDDFLNRWLTDWIASGAKRPTVRSVRGAIVTLLRAAADDGLCGEPRKVKVIRRATPLVTAWTIDQVRAVLVACDALPGSFANGPERSKMFRAMFTVGWYSGLRPGDLLGLKARDLLPSGLLTVIQSKTHHPIRCLLPADAMDAIRACFPPARERLFPINRDQLTYWFDKIRESSGVGGSPKWMRRTGTTAIERLQRGLGMAYLGHKTPGVAERHYIDWAQIDAVKPLPPPLTDAG